jgi:hypothetical protein
MEGVQNVVNDHSGGRHGLEVHDDTQGMVLRLVLQLDDEELRLGCLEAGEGDAPETVSKDSVEQDLSKLRLQLADLLGLQRHGKVADQIRCLSEE